MNNLNQMTATKEQIFFTLKRTRTSVVVFRGHKRMQRTVTNV
jgi:hypothetical protein